VETENFKGYRYKGSEHSRNLTEMKDYDKKTEHDSFIKQNEALLASLKKNRDKKQNPNMTVNVSVKEIKRLLPPID